MVGARIGAVGAGTGPCPRGSESRRLRLWAGCLLIAFAVGCGEEEPKAEVPPSASGEGPRPRVGQVMVETGHRFETSGRARVAGRWELAAYEAHEIMELFEDDFSRALLPGACTDEVAEAMFARLLDEQLPALRDAAEAHDGAAYDAAFDTASRSCNGCHTTCEVTFVSVPGRPGLEVPALGPLDEPATEAPPAVPDEAPAAAPAP